MRAGGVETGGGGARAPVDDAVAGAVLAILAIVALAWFIPAHTDTAAGEYDVSPAFFPSLAASVVLALAAALALIGLVRVRGGGPAAPSVGVRALLELLAWSAAAALTMVGLSSIGFVATAALLIAGAMLLAGHRGWVSIAVAAVGFPLLLDAAAWWIFTVEMP